MTRVQTVMGWCTIAVCLCIAGSMVALVAMGHCKCPERGVVLTAAPEISLQAQQEVIR